MHRFFDAMMGDIRASTSNNPPPSFRTAPLSRVLRVFRPSSIVDVGAAVWTKLLKDNFDVFASFLVELFNRSYALGVMLSIYKSVSQHHTTVEGRPWISRCSVKFQIFRYFQSQWNKLSRDNYSTIGRRWSCGLVVCVGDNKFQSLFMNLRFLRATFPAQPYTRYTPNKLLVRRIGRLTGLIYVWVHYDTSLFKQHEFDFSLAFSENSATSPFGLC